jgi:T5orf172 domain
MVYAMRFEGRPGQIKLGKSDNVERRADELSSVFGCATILKTVPGSFKEEQAIKRRFGGFRVRGTEFFLIHREIESWIGRPLVS